MDKSKEYVEMCKKAKEIQESWVAEVGDFWTYGDGGSSVSIMCYDECFGVQKEEGQIWLLRQDQLQEFIFSNFLSEYGEERWLIWGRNDMLNRFTKFSYSQKELLSMEQLWLAFLMKEKYNKRWDGEDWVEEK